MTSLSCTSSDDAAALRDYITKYASHPNQLLYNDKVFVSTFSGESCKFGQSTVDDGWNYALKTGLPDVYFVPSFFVDPTTFSQYNVLDGAFGVRGPCRDIASRFADPRTVELRLAPRRLRHRFRSGSELYLEPQWPFIHGGGLSLVLHGLCLPFNSLPSLFQDYN